MGHALEALGVIATHAPPAARALSPERAALRAARTCYDHLAGTLAVALADKMEREQLVRAEGERAYAITSRGKRWLEGTLGVEVSTVLEGRRDPARRCLDWRERRPHVAGALGAAILRRLLAMRWAARTRTRVLRITPGGREALVRLGLGQALA